MRTLSPVFAAVLMLAAPAVAAQGSAAGPATTTTVPIDGVVAVVGNQPILHTDVEERLGAMFAGRPLPSDSATRARLERDVLNSLIDEALLVQQAKAEKIEVADNEITASVNQQFSKVRAQFPNENEFRTQLRSAGFGTPDEYRRWLMDEARKRLLQQKLFQKLRDEQKLAPAPVSAEEVEEFFEANKDQISTLPATVTYREIVITPQPSAQEDSAARAKAESLLVEIRNGGDFAQIAKRESMDPGTKELGGDLGWHRRGEFVNAFDRMYFALPPGQVGPVVKTTFGYHIIKVDRVQPAEVKGRHILIRPTIDSADVARARRLADSVAQLWRNGANYDSLVAKYHDPAEEKLMPEPFPQDSLPVEYQNAIKGHKAGDILDPFPIEDPTTHIPKFFILELTSVSEAREPTVADYRERIRDQLAQEKGMRRYLDNLRKQTYVAIRR